VQLPKNVPAFYEAGRFVIVFTRALHQSCPHIPSYVSCGVCIGYMDTSSTMNHSTPLHQLSLFLQNSDFGNGKLREVFVFEDDKGLTERLMMICKRYERTVFNTAMIRNVYFAHALLTGNISHFSVC
jgi:hypothetical protein